MEYKTLESLSNKAAVLTIVVVILYGFSLGAAYTCQFGTTNTDVLEKIPHDTTSQLYLSLNQPALCSGVITKLQFCYYVIDSGGGGQMLSTVIQVWRKESNGTLRVVNDYELVVEHVRSNNVVSPDPGRIFCQNRTLDKNEYISVLTGDVLGVFYAENKTSSPLQLIFSTTMQNSTSDSEGEPDIHFTNENTSVGDVQKGYQIDRLQLKSNCSLVMHLSAEIGLERVSPVTNILKSSSEMLSVITTEMTTPLPTHAAHTNTVTIATSQVTHDGAATIKVIPTQLNARSSPIFTPSNIVQSTSLNIETTLISTIKSVQSIPLTIQASEVTATTSARHSLVTESVSLIPSSLSTLLPAVVSTIEPLAPILSTIMKSRAVIQSRPGLSIVPQSSLPFIESTAGDFSNVAPTLTMVEGSITLPTEQFTITPMTSNLSPMKSSTPVHSIVTQINTLILSSLPISMSTSESLSRVTSTVTVPMVGKSTIGTLRYASLTVPASLVATSVPLSPIATSTAFTGSGVSVSVVTPSLSQNKNGLQTQSQGQSFHQTFSHTVSSITHQVLPSLSRRQFTPSTHVDTVLSVDLPTSNTMANTIQPTSTHHGLVLSTTVLTTNAQSFLSSGISALAGITQFSSFVRTKTEPIGTANIFPKTPSISLDTLIVRSSSSILPEIITSSVVSLETTVPLDTPLISLSSSIGMTSSNTRVTTLNRISSAVSPTHVSLTSSPTLTTFHALSSDTIISNTQTTFKMPVSTAATTSQIKFSSMIPSETQIPSLSTASPLSQSTFPITSSSLVPSSSKIIDPPQSLSSNINIQHSPTPPATISTVPVTNSNAYITAIIIGTTIIAILFTALAGCTIITCMIVVYYKTKMSKVKTVSSSESSTPLSLSARHFSIDNPNYQSGFPSDVEMNHQPFNPTLNEFTNRGFKSQSEENLLSNGNVPHSRSRPNGVRVPSDYETPVVVIPNRNGLMVSPVLQRKNIVSPVNQTSHFDSNFPNNQRSIVSSASPILNLQPYKVVHIVNVSDSHCTPNPHEYDEPVDGSFKQSHSASSHPPKNGITRVSDYEVPVLIPPLAQNDGKSSESLELVPLHTNSVEVDKRNGTSVTERHTVMESKAESLQTSKRQNGKVRRHESEPRPWNKMKHRKLVDLNSQPTTTSPHTKDIHDSNRVSSSMDGPYRRPPLDEDEIHAVLTQMGVEVIPKENIRTHISLSSVQFQPLKSEWRSNKEAPWIEVDVKVIGKKEENSSDRIKLLQEAAIMAQFRHPNVMRLHGIVTEGETIMVVMEHFQKGDLRKCLVQMGRSVIPPDTPKLLLNYSQQIALGMHYLSSKGFLHKDLAARNVFVTKDDNCKVGEFGKSRDLSNASHYIASGGKIPVRWTAPEAMYYQKYSTTSDIWSYGCLLYEIWSLGRMPFREFTNAEVIKKIDSGYRLPPPPGCPRVIYDVMIQCWHPKPLFRPTFKDIISTLLADESHILQIPVSDASTHESAIILGASLDAGKYMYTDLQNHYHQQARRPLRASQSSSVGENKKHSDYDHISGQKYVTSFPTSSKDIDYMYKGPLDATTQQPQSVAPNLSPTLKTRNVHALTRSTDSHSNGTTNSQAVCLEPERTTNGHVAGGTTPAQNVATVSHSGANYADQLGQKGEVNIGNDAADYEDIETY